MIQKRKNKHRSNRTILRLPDLDHSKSSVLQSLGSAASKRTYGTAIEDFITWYCSEPRLAFGRTVVLRYRYELEARHLAPATINLRLAAVRRLAYEASDNGLLNPDLAAGIRREKGGETSWNASRQLADSGSGQEAPCSTRQHVCAGQTRLRDPVTSPRLRASQGRVDGLDAWTPPATG